MALTILVSVWPGVLYSSSDFVHKRDTMARKGTYVDNEKNRRLGRVGKAYGFVAPKPVPEPERWSRRVRGLEPVVSTPSRAAASPELVRREPSVVSVVESPRVALFPALAIAPASPAEAEVNGPAGKDVTVEAVAAVTPPELPRDVTPVVTPLVASPILSLDVFSPIASEVSDETEVNVTADDDEIRVEEGVEVLEATSPYVVVGSPLVVTQRCWEVATTVDVASPATSPFMVVGSPLVGTHRCWEVATAVEVASPVVELALPLPEAVFRLKGMVSRQVSRVFSRFFRR